MSWQCWGDDNPIRKQVPETTQEFDRKVSKPKICDNVKQTFRSQLKNCWISVKIHLRHKAIISSRTFPWNCIKRKPIQGKTKRYCGSDLWRTNIPNKKFDSEAQDQNCLERRLKGCQIKALTSRWALQTSNWGSILS